MKAENISKNKRPGQSQEDKAVSEQKKRIYAQLKAYRKAHGLGCFKNIAEATGGKIAIGTLANMYTGTKVNDETWLQVGEALERLSDL
jgi:hypothetical protein